MEKLGIVVDGLQIQEIEDPPGYIKNLAAPHAAGVASAARIMAAERDKEAAEREQEAARAKAQFERQTAIAQAKIQAEIQQAEAEAAQRLVDMLPALVQASAKGIEGSRLTILGGSQGVTSSPPGWRLRGCRSTPPFRACWRAAPTVTATAAPRLPKPMVSRRS